MDSRKDGPSGFGRWVFNQSLKNQKAMQQERIEQRLRKIILENEGDRDDIYSDVFDFVKPLIDALTGIAQHSGVYSKDPLVHAQNTIKNCEQIANSALNEALEITSE